jgi:hypothetical protein
MMTEREAAVIGTNIKCDDEFFGDSVLSVEHGFFGEKQFVSSW